MFTSDTNKYLYVLFSMENTRSRTLIRINEIDSFINHIFYILVTLFLQYKEHYVIMTNWINYRV